MAASQNLDDSAEQVLVGVGANVASSIGSPRETCEAALESLGKAGVKIVRRSRWYRTAPVPPSTQPWYVNAVIAVETALDPVQLLALLHDVERRFGRVRGERGAARTLDLDLLDFRGELREGNSGPHLPHPRLHERAFVLAPLADVAPGWRHPRLGLTVRSLLEALPPGQAIEAE